MCSSHDERFAEQYQLAIEMSIVDFQGSDVLDQLAAVHWALPPSCRGYRDRHGLSSDELS